jgi:hypothetical protein
MRAPNIEPSSPDSYYLRRVAIGTVIGYSLIMTGITDTLSADTVADNPCPAPPSALVQEAKTTIMHNGIVNSVDDAALTKRLGLTLPKTLDADIKHYTSLLNDQQLPFDQQTIPFMEYFNETRAILAESGVTLRFGTPADITAYPGERPPILSDFENATSKKAITLLMEDLESMPTDYFKWIGLKEAILTTGHFDVAAYALTGDKHDKLHFNLQAEYTSNVFKHEAAHLADTVMCGSPEAAANDPSITVINGGTPYGLQDDDVKAHSQSTWMSAPIPHDIATADKVVFTDPYAGTKVVEDKAQSLAASQSNGRLGSSSLNNMAVIDKMAVEYGRMLQPENAPQIGRFFLEMTQGQYNPYAVGK